MSIIKLNSAVPAATGAGESKGNTGLIVLGLLTLAAAGAWAYYEFVMKPKEEKENGNKQSAESKN